MGAVVGPLLGGFEEVEWHDVVLELEPGNTLLVYTDGVTDAVGNEGERYGLRRLQATLDQCRHLPASQVIESVMTGLSEFQTGQHADDTAALALRRLAADPRAAATGEASQAAPVEALASSR